MLIEEGVYDISNLSNLRSIDSDLQISDTDLLNLYAFSNLKRIGGGLHLWGNGGLRTLKGLNNVVEIGNNLQISSNDNLENLEGLNNLSVIGSNLNVGGNKSLIEINELSNVVCLGGDLNIGENVKLENIDGLRNIPSIIGRIYITNNESLLDVDALSNVSSVRKDVQLIDNGILNIDGLSNLTAIGEKFVIARNFWVENLNGLSKLKSVGSKVSVQRDNMINEMFRISNLLYLKDVVYLAKGLRLDVHNLRREGKRRILTTNYYLHQELSNCSNSECGYLDALVILSPEKKFMSIKIRRQNNFTDHIRSLVSIYSANGRLLSKQILKDQKIILPIDLAAGFYTIKMKTKDLLKVTKLVVLE